MQTRPLRRAPGQTPLTPPPEQCLRGQRPIGHEKEKRELLEAKFAGDTARKEIARNARIKKQ